MLESIRNNNINAASPGLVLSGAVFIGCHATFLSGKRCVTPPKTAAEDTSVGCDNFLVRRFDKPLSF